MKLERLCLKAAMILAICIPASVRAQEVAPSKSMTHRYAVVDLGSFGGGNAYAQGVALPFFPGTRALNNSGVAAAWGDRTVLDSFAPFCYVDCSVGYALEWKNGAAQNLGALAQNPPVGKQPACTMCNWSSFPLAISGGGVIVGESENNAIDNLTQAPVSLAVVWKNGSIYNLGTFGGNQSGAIGVNDWGDVVGGALTTSSESYPRSPYFDVFIFGYGTTSHAFWWRDGVMHDLKTLGGPDSMAFFVNDWGQIAGASDLDFSANASQLENPGGPTVHPFVWQNGKMHDLMADAPSDLFGGTYGIVSSLNNLGQITGIMNLMDDQTWHSFLWDHGKVKDIGTLGGTFTTAHWLNDTGMIVGRSSVAQTCDSCTGNAPQQFSHPFVWKDNTMTDLGLPPGAQCGTAKQINNLGQVVGQSFLGVTAINLDFCEGSSTGAFVWKDNSMVDLQTLLVPGSGIVLNDAFNINDQGQILATGFNGNGNHRVVLLVPCDDDE